MLMNRTIKDTSKLKVRFGKRGVSIKEAGKPRFFITYERLDEFVLILHNGLISHKKEEVWA